MLEQVEKMKQVLLSRVMTLGKELPLNTLDELIDHFGGPEHVAEVGAGAKAGLAPLAVHYSASLKTQALFPACNTPTSDNGEPLFRP